MLAVVFPGQGAQRVGMSFDFAERFPEARAVFEEADDAFGGTLSRWIREGPEESLRRTEVTQPAVLAASIAVYRVVEPRLPEPPSFVAGHSLGEYSALVASGALALGDAIRLVRLRGRLMQEAVPEGAGEMAAVMGLGAEEVERICARHKNVFAANYNSDAQIVIAGERDAVRDAGDDLRSAGAKRVTRLEVSAPFHSPLMRPAAEKLATALATLRFGRFRCPVISNVTGRPYDTAEEAREVLREQVCAPVRWVDCLRTLAASGVRSQLEVGPGRVLTGLVARIDRSLARANVEEVGDLDRALESLSGASS